MYIYVCRSRPNLKFRRSIYVNLCTSTFWSNSSPISRLLLNCNTSLVLRPQGQILSSTASFLGVNLKSPQIIVPMKDTMLPCGVIQYVKTRLGYGQGTTSWGFPVRLSICWFNQSTFIEAVYFLRISTLNYICWSIWLGSDHLIHQSLQTTCSSCAESPHLISWKVVWPAPRDTHQVLLIINGVSTWESSGSQPT